MTKQKKARKGQQLLLCEILPAKAQPIIELAEQYEDIVQKRVKLLKKEILLKENIKRLIKDAELQPLKGNIIRIKYDNLIVEMEPRDEVIHVKKVKKKK